MLTIVSCLFFYFVGLTVLKKKKISQIIMSKHEKRIEKPHKHTRKIKKHQAYLFCDIVSLSDQRNIGRIKINSIRLLLNIVYF